MVCPEGGSAGASVPAGAMAGGPTPVFCHRLPYLFLAGCVTLKIIVNIAAPATRGCFSLAYFLLLEGCSLWEVEISF